MPDTLTLLITHGLAGDLTRMARLATYLERLQRAYPQAVLLDMGGMCAESVWHCAATDGRSALVMLDGMGYHAAHVAGILSADSRHRLHGLTTMALADTQHAWRLNTPHWQDEGIIFSSTPTPCLTLNIVLTPADTTRLDNGTLFLQPPPAYSVLRVMLGLLPVPSILATALHMMPPDTTVHPTLAAAAEFIEEEAQAARQRRDRES